ncbi:zinc-dependent alcohol dehydrogenase [Microbacterium yannicii]|uniref:zinc-dependent alcohol dehydrogenase n=1 Tax=Microbacterium yannicii TaxID=671622 RepID=UPI0003151309|nr:alcohol dehydrogenase catalytic domain-containing protein [Microbacterium yannicii]
MRAVAFTPEGEAVIDHRDPVPGPDEVLVEVEYCGICGSDLHAAQPDFHVGNVMGHEFTGTVLETGSDVTDYRPGDRVVVNPNGDWCGRCGACTRGEVNMCERLGETAVGLARDGGLAPFAAVRRSTLHRLPDAVDFASAALIEPLAVAIRTVRNSGIAIGDDAVVFGGGPIGLLVTTVLKAAGAGTVTVVEPAAARRGMALRQGAAAVIDPAVSPIEEHFPDAGTAPRFAFECSGVAELVGVAVKTVRPRGTVTVTGYSRRPPTFDATDLLFKEVTIRGSFIYVGEFAQAIGLLERGAVDVSPLISGVVGIEEAPRAFDLMRTSPDAIKYLISARAQTHDGVTPI